MGNILYRSRAVPNLLRRRPFFRDYSNYNIIKSIAIVTQSTIVLVLFN